MEEFKLILDFEIKKSATRTIRAVISRKVEDAFWKDFRRQTNNLSAIPAETHEIHRRIRDDLPRELKAKLAEALSAELLSRTMASQAAAPQATVGPTAAAYPVDVGPTAAAAPQATVGPTAAAEAPQPAPSPSASYAPTIETKAQKEAEISDAISALNFRVKRISYGSLELILLVFAFTKLSEVAGIDREDFAKYLEIFTPIALNGIFGTNVALEAIASPTEASSAAQAVHPGLAVGAWPALAYLVPAAFALAAAGVVIYLGSSALRGVASSLVEERKMIAANLHDEMNAITADRGKLTDSFLNVVQKHEDTTAAERKAIAEQLASLASKMTDTEQKKDDALARAQKQLLESQMDFIKVVNAGASARDAAVVDFVKARLGGTTPPAPAPHPVATNSNYFCTLNRVEMIRLQGALKDRGFFTTPIDGLYGPKTGDALGRLQVEEKLTLTRYPDKASLDYLGMACNPASSASSTRAELVR